MRTRQLTRRSALVGVAALLSKALASEAAAASHPLLWRISRGSARVYLFPTGEAPDGSWFTPSVRSAFASSSELWLELGPPPPEKRREELYEQLGRDSARTFLDALEPSVRTRATQYMEELAIPEDSVRTLRPWLAYYTFVSAFDKKYRHSEGFTDVKADQLPPEFALAGQARREGKAIHYELTMEESLQRLAGFSDRQQSQYLQWLFDYFDDEKRGRHRDKFAWLRGQPPAQSIERMRTQLPDLYQVMSVRRNEWWARTIGTLLSRSGTSFIAIGANHVLGPDGIPRLLTRTATVQASEMRLL